MRFTLPVLFPSQLLFFLRILNALFLRHICDKMKWYRFYIVCEEYITNFFKYGRKRHSLCFCWFRITIEENQIGCLFKDAGMCFNPEKYVPNCLGLRLMTQLLVSRYRWCRGCNYFCVKLGL